MWKGKEVGTGFNHRDIKVNNEQLILRAINEFEPISRADLSRKTDLSKPAVSSAVETLLAKEFINEQHHEEYDKVGRKPQLLSINEEGIYFLSADVGGTNTRIGITNLRKEIVKQDSLKTPDNWQALISTLTKYAQVDTWSDIETSKVKSFAVAIPGVVSPTGEVSVTPNIGGPDSISLKEELEKRVPIDCIIENDANSAALGEFGKVQSSYSSLVYVSIGTGVGSGLILDNSLYRGHSFRAGEVGWFLPNEECLKDKHSDKTGSLENRISGPGVYRLTLNGIKSNNIETMISADMLEEKGPKVVFDFYNKDKLAKDIVTGWLKDVSAMIVNISSLVDPGAVVLGGGVMKSAHVHIKDIEEKVDMNTQKAPEILISSLGDEAALYGGIELCWNKLGDLLWE